MPRNKNKDGLTASQVKFCEEFIKSYNATQAYLAAYPNTTYDTANSAGPKYLKNPAIKAYLDKLEKEEFEAKRINAEHIASELAKMAFGEISKGNSQGGKIKALELLQKQLGLQTANIKADVDNNINITIDED